LHSPMIDRVGWSRLLEGFSGITFSTWRVDRSDPSVWWRKQPSKGTDNLNGVQWEAFTVSVP
jgi:hypothetical protein